MPFIAKFNMRKYQHIYNAGANILAVEYLIKELNYKKFFDNIEILLSFDDADMRCLDVDLSLNRHADNLGLMIIEGDYDEQKEILLSALRTKRATGAHIDDNKTVSDVINSMTKEQQNILYYIVGKLMNAKENEGDDE